MNTESLENNLTSMANILRTKNKITNDLSFPSEYISQINNLYVINDWLDANKPVGEIYMTSSSIPENCLTGRVKIMKVFGTNVTSIGASGLQNCTGLIYLILPKCYTLYSTAVQGCTKLTTVDLGGTPSSSQGFIRQSGFSGCTKLATLILRGNAVWALSNINNFTNTCFASGKTGGTLYVPRALIDSYKAATNWSTILGYTKTDGETLQNKILPIEDSMFYASYGDGTPLPNAHVSSTGKGYFSNMRIDISRDRTDGYTIAQTLDYYGNMPNLEELTLTGIAREDSANCLLPGPGNNIPRFSNERYPQLKKLYIQPTEQRNSDGSIRTSEHVRYNKFGCGHYVFTGTNLTELVLGKTEGPYFLGGGYFRGGDLPCPPGTSGNQVGSLDGLTITVYIDPSNTYANRAGFQNSTLAPNTTLICKDYTTGETFTPS